MTSSKCHMRGTNDVNHAKLQTTMTGRNCHPGFCDPGQREMAERRHHAALDQFHSMCARQPLRIARPGEFSGAEAERSHHRLQPLLDKAAHPGIGPDPGQDDQPAARPQHTGELVQRRFRIRHRGHDVLRHYDIEGIVGKFEFSGVHHREALDVLQAKFGDPALCLAQHCFRNIGADDAEMRGILRQRDSGADADLEHTAPDLVGSVNGRLAAFGEHAAKHQVVDRRPAIIGLFDRFAVKVQLPCVLKLDGFDHDKSRLLFDCLTQPCTALVVATTRADRSERLGCNALRLPMNCLALFSQERSSAKLRQVSREMLSARMQALRRSLSKAPTGWPAITSSGPVTGKAATGVPHASASSWTTPKVSVRLGQTKTSASARWDVKSLQVFSPRNLAFGYRRCNSALCGPSPITILDPGKSNGRNASRLFSTATRPTVMKIGLGRSSSAGSLGGNRPVSTPRVQLPSFRKPLAPSSCLSEAAATIAMAAAA